MLDYILYIAIISSIFGLFMILMDKTSIQIKGCPCKKIMQSGLTAKYFAYFGSFCFMYSVTFIGFNDYNIKLFVILACSLALMYTSFAIKA